MRPGATCGGQGEGESCLSPALPAEARCQQAQPTLHRTTPSPGLVPSVAKPLASPLFPGTPGLDHPVIPQKRQSGPLDPWAASEKQHKAPMPGCFWMELSWGIPEEPAGGGGRKKCR